MTAVLPDATHDVLLYTDADHLRGAALGFVRAGLAAGDAVLVALGDEDNDVLADELGRDAAAAVEFVASGSAGKPVNPARMVAHRVGWVGDVRGARAVADTGWAALGAGPRGEVLLTDALLDTLCGAGRPMSMLCGYPVALAGTDRDDVLSCHEGVHGVDGPNADYRDDRAATLFARPLPEPTGPVNVFVRNGRPLQALREFVAEHARAAHVAPARIEDLVLAAHEVAGNSLRHGGTDPIVRMWRHSEPAAGDAVGRQTVVCEVRDRGVIDDPLAGRLLPGIDRQDGRGLWLAGELCELAQVRSAPAFGTVVRLVVPAAR